MNAALAGGVFEKARRTDDLTELRELVNRIGSLARQTRGANRTPADDLDAPAWRHLEDAGLTRLTSTTDSGGGPTELAVILRSLAYYAVSVPLAETDLLACWLAELAGLTVPQRGPVAIGHGSVTSATLTAPYAGSAETAVLALRDGDDLLVSAIDAAALAAVPAYNLGGEPRDSVPANLPRTGYVTIKGVAEEFIRRGAWARCMQTIGALDAAVEFSVLHTRERAQFGRPLSAFQAVQHTLTSMAGEAERARAAATLAVAAASDYGFDSPQAEYAITVAKIVLGEVVPAICGSAHQLHGAIGVTVEHPLWLATMRARSWIDEFGSTAHYARKLGDLALRAAHGDRSFDVIIGVVSAAHWTE
jgi:acyl-CoA dehydrogenase